MWHSGGIGETMLLLPPRCLHKRNSIRTVDGAYLIYVFQGSFQPGEGASSRSGRGGPQVDMEETNGTASCLTKALLDARNVVVECRGEEVSWWW